MTNRLYQYNDNFGLSQVCHYSIPCPLYCKTETNLSTKCYQGTCELKISSNKPIVLSDSYSQNPVCAYMITNSSFSRHYLHRDCA